MRPNIEAAVKAAGIEKLVTITGWISSDEVRAHVAAARAFVLPSFAENMPVVIMEAFAQGRPVISTYIAGIPELVQPGKTGWLVPSGDAAALAEALKEMLAATPQQLAAMGAAGRAHILANHDALTEARKLKQLFERV
jgi:glycosyltransferase involved in cell wall biosynthesis